MTAERFMNWVLGVGFVLMTAMFWIAIHERDTARTATIITDGAVISVRCEEPRND